MLWRHVRAVESPPLEVEELGVLAGRCVRLGTAGTPDRRAAIGERPSPRRTGVTLGPRSIKRRAARQGEGAAKKKCVHGSRGGE